MRRKICRLWTNFAKYNDPTPVHEKLISVQWTPVLADTKDVNLDYFIINDDMRMVRNINKQRVDFWKRIYEKWNKSFLKPKL